MRFVPRFPLRVTPFLESLRFSGAFLPELHLTCVCLGSLGREEFVIETAIVAFHEASHHRALDLAEFLQRQSRESSQNSIIVREASGWPLFPNAAPKQERGAEHVVSVQRQ